MAIDEVIDRRHHHAAPGDISQGHWNQAVKQSRPIQFSRGDGKIFLDQDAERDEVHIGDAVFEARSDECRDRKNNRKDLVDDATPGQREPHRETDQDVTQDSLEEGLPERYRGLGRGDLHHVGADRTIVHLPVARKVDQIGQADGAAKFAR